MSPPRVASPFPTARPLRLPASVLRTTPPAALTLRSQVAARVGATLRGLRLASGASGQVLAHRAGLSRSLLSRLERGLISPSLDTLESVAGALGVPEARLLQMPSERGGFCHVPAGQGMRVEHEASKGRRCELIGHPLPGILAVEPCLVVQQADASPPATSQAGIRFVYVLSGRGVYAHGSRVVPVKAGDALLFDANVPHGVQTTEATAVAVLSVLFALRG